MVSDKSLDRLDLISGHPATLVFQNHTVGGFYFNKFQSSDKTNPDPIGITVFYKDNNQLVLDSILLPDLKNIQTERSLVIEYEQRNKLVFDNKDVRITELNKNEELMFPEKDYREVLPYCKGAIERFEKNKSNVPRYSVMVIGMQEEYLMDVSKPVKNKVIAAQLDLLEFCRKTNLPIISAEYIENGNIPEIQSILEKTENKYQFENYNHNQVIGSTIEKKLNEFGTTHVILTGFDASLGVEQTARNLRKTGISIATAPDLIANKETFQPPFESFYRSHGSFAKTYLQLVDVIKQTLNHQQ